MTGAGDSRGFGYLATVIASGLAHMPPEESVVCLPVNRPMRITPLAAIGSFPSSYSRPRDKDCHLGRAVTGGAVWNRLSSIGANRKG
jgi:hypothetical protein